MLLLKDHNKTALVAGSLEMSYRQFMQDIDRRAETLKQHNFSKAAFFAENSPGWALTFYAVWKQDGIAVPVDHMSTAGDVAYILNDCQPEILFCSSGTHAIARKAVEQAKTNTVIVLLDETISDEIQGDSPAAFQRNPEDTAVIIYTSGTTGSPKGVMLSFRNLEVNCNAIVQADIFTPQQRILVMLPLHHILPLVGTLVGTLFCGATMIFSPSLAPGDIMETLQQHHATMIIGVPRFYALISANIRAKIQASAVARTLYALAHRLKSPAFSRRIFSKVHEKFGGQMRILVSGGAPLDPAVAECLETLGFSVLEGFGMTETAPMITFPRPAFYKLGACGQALPDNEVQIKDGEIITRGPNVMQGYYNRPEETAAIIHDGWLHTGDLGYLDDDGFLYVTGRKKEIIVLPSGKNVNPVELEENITSLVPAIQEIAVVMQGSILHAIIRTDTGLSEEEIQLELNDKYNRHTAPYKRISRVHIIAEELPRTRMGKIRRFQLADLIAEKGIQKEEKEPAPDSPVYHKLHSCLSAIVDIPIGPDDRLDADLGIDSLGRINLQVFIQEAFGIELQEADFEQNPTLRALTHSVESRKTKDDNGHIDWQHILRSSIPLQLPRCGLIYTFIVTTSKLFMRLWFKLRIYGRENIPNSPVIIAANHQSYIDGLFITSALSLKRMRQTFFYAKKKHVNNAFLRYLAQHNNVIVVDVNNRLRESVQKLAAALREGKNLIIFPEGTRTRTGEPGTFKPTFAILSAELNIPILPVTISGAFEAMPAGRHSPRFRSPVDVTIAPPVYPDKRDHQALAAMIQNRIEQNLLTHKRNG